MKKHLLILVALMVLVICGTKLRHGRLRPAANGRGLAPTLVTANTEKSRVPVQRIKEVFSPAAGSTRNEDAVPATGEKRARLVQADWDFLQNPASPVHDGDRRQPIRLDLFDDVAVDFKVESTRYLEPGVFVVTGNTGTPLSLAVFASVHGAVVATIIDPAKGHFTVEPTARPGVSRIYENDPRSFACGLPGEDVVHRPLSLNGLATTAPGVQAGEAASAPATETSDPTVAADTFAGGNLNDFWSGLTAPSGGTRIPLLALYNADLAAKAIALFGNLDGLRARMEAGIAITNAMMVRARATAYIELVGMAQVTFAEPAVPSSSTLLGLIKQTPEFSDLQAKYRPALTTYMITAENPSVSGFSGVAERPGQLNSVYYRYLNSIITAHELGHNFGMQHNVEDASVPDTRIPYSFGWRLSGSTPLVGDAMSYPFPGKINDMFELPVYSDPTVTFQGIPLGHAQVADNARLARESTATVAAYAGFQFGAVGDNWITNLSTRGYVGSGDQVLIAGLIVSGDVPKQLVLRGVGPSLGPHGIQQPLGDPRIQLYAGSTVIKENDNWEADARAADLKALSLAPSNPAEAALLVTLNPGAYTVILSGVGKSTGVGLIEAYEMDSALSRFTYWNANQVSQGYGTFAESPLEFTYDFAGTFRNSPVLFKLTSAPAGKFLLVARQDSGSATAIDPYLQVIQYPKGQNPYVMTGSSSVAANDNWRDSSSAGMLLNSGISGLGESKTAVVMVDTNSNFDYWLVAAPGNPNLAHPTAGALRVGLYNLTGTASVGESNRLVNVSTRGTFADGEKVMIAGFIIKGSSSRTLAVRALGQTLAQYGLTGLAPNPKFTLFDAANKVLFANDDWQKDVTSTMLQKWGLAPSDASEAGMVVTLQPGAYTVVVENNGREGVGIVEVFELR